MAPLPSPHTRPRAPRQVETAEAASSERHKELAALALRNLVASSKAAARRVVDAGGIDALATLAMQGTPAQRGKAAGALNQLAVQDDVKGAQSNRVKMIECGFYPRS